MKSKITIILNLLYLLISIQVKGQTNKSEQIIYQKPLFDFDYYKPLFKLQNEQSINKNRSLRFSALTGYRAGVESIKGFVNFDSYLDKKNGTIRIYFINSSISDIITFGTLKANRVVLEVREPSRYRYDPSLGSKLEWIRKNTYCFEFLYPFGSLKDEEPLKEELCNAFGVRFKREKRLINSLVLFRTSNLDKIKSKGEGKGSYDMAGHFNNVPIDRLAHPLDESGLPPLVNETGYTGNVDLDLDIESWSDIVHLRKQLKKYDLDLREEKREIEVMVITENNFNK